MKTYIPPHRWRECLRKKNIKQDGGVRAEDAIKCIKMFTTNFAQLQTGLGIIFHRFSH